MKLPTVSQFPYQSALGRSLWQHHGFFPHHSPMPNADAAYIRRWACATFCALAARDDVELYSTIPNPFPLIFLA